MGKRSERKVNFLICILACLVLVFSPAGTSLMAYSGEGVVDDEIPTEEIIVEEVETEEIFEGVNVNDYDNSIDYMKLMEECIEQGTPMSLNMGKIYEKQRNMKIIDNSLPYETTTIFEGEDLDTIKKNLMEYKGIYNKKEVPAPVYYTEEEVVIVAKIMYNEARGIPSDTEKACVAWTICNRVDNGYGRSIKEIATAPNQFAYRYNTPVTDELYTLSRDVLNRWSREKNGEVNVGRVLPSDYLYFTGDGKHNYFRNSFRGGSIWNYSLSSPYNS